MHQNVELLKQQHLFTETTSVIMRNTILLLLLLASPLLGQSQNVITGYVLDAETRETLPFVNVYIELESRALGGTTTDFDGRFTLNCPIPIDSLLVFQALGYLNKSVSVSGLEPSTVFRMGTVLLEPDPRNMWFGCPPPYHGSLYTSEVITPKRILLTETRYARSQQDLFFTIANQTPGVSSASDNNELHFKGSRSDANLILLDGMKIRGALNIPLSAVKSTEVYGNGTPACYGDATGTVISIDTKDYIGVANDHEVYYHFRDYIVVY